MESTWWSFSANTWLTDFRTPIALVFLIGLLWKRLEWAVFLIWIYYVILCPFTKVEESFNVQAMHDILFYGGDIDQYDHLEFPGVVPRTFAGPLFVAGFSWPLVTLSRFVGMPKLYGLVIVRMTLAFLVFLCFRRFTAAIRRSFGAKVAFWVCLLTLFQFHFNFYASRPLPNVFALALALLTFGCCINGEFKAAIWPAVFSALIFRSELVLLYAPIFLPLLFNGGISLRNAILHGLGAAISALAITVPLDSWFWRRWLWPEGEVWYYNVILNKSSDWGTSPFLWYFYSVLPRSLLLSLPLAPVGACLDSRARPIFAAALVFITLYSVLPHKELRFIIYTFPLLNVTSAIACDRVFENRRKSIVWSFLCIGVVGHLIINGYASSIFARAAHGNYPGAVALQSLHSMEKRTSHVRVHIDVYCAQTGISRFLHEHDRWEYNKSESLVDGGRDIRAFDYLLIGSVDGQNLTKAKGIFAGTHTPLKEIEGFHRIDLVRVSRQWNFLKVINVTWTPRVIVFRK